MHTMTIERTCPDCGSTDHLCDCQVCTTSRQCREEGCSHCKFWAFQFATPGGFVIDGWHYRIDEEPTPGQLKTNPRLYGFGGREFRIRFGDGREVVTHNLMTQGEIPPGLTRPDNAEFVRG